MVDIADRLSIAAALCEEDAMLTRREAATYLRRTVNTLERWTALGMGPPCRKVGGKVLYPLSGVRRFAGAGQSAAA